jgi:hypothetical protein
VATGSAAGSSCRRKKARRRGCTRAALFTLTFQAPGFYLKHGYDIAARLDCNPPGATRMLMTKRL